MKRWAYFVAGLILGTVCLSHADMFSPKSTGLTSIPKITELEQVEDILREHARAIDLIHRNLKADLDDIDRDEIPALESSISGRVDFRLPLLKNVVFSYDGGSTVTSWTAGTMEYDGTSYTVSSGSSDAADIAVWYDLDGLTDPVVFSHTNSVGIATNRWVFAIIYSGTLYETFSSPIIHGGLIQGSTVTATQIATDAVTASEANLTNIFAADITVNSTGEIHSTDKDAWDDATSGFWLGWDAGNNDWCLDIGDDTEYIQWDGSNIDIFCTGGRIGSTTDYFDLDNDRIQFLSGGVYVKLSSGGLQFSDYEFGGVPGNTFSFINSHYCVVRGDGSSGGGVSVNKSDGSTLAFALYVDAADLDQATLGIDPANRIMLDGSESDWSVNGFELVRCRVMPAANGTPLAGDLKYNTGTNKLQVYTEAGWETVTSS